LGETLTVGLSYKREQLGKTILSLQLRTLMDMLQLPSISITSMGSDGVNTFIKLDQPLTAPILLKYENGDVLSYTVNDDLSGLALFRVSAGCRLDIRN